MALKIGQKVRVRSTGEVGVVVWIWQNEHDDTDVYVAFFGNEFPETNYSNGTMPDRPYILRYFDSSLEPID